MRVALLEIDTAPKSTSREDIKRYINNDKGSPLICCMYMFIGNWAKSKLYRSSQIQYFNRLTGPSLTTGWDQIPAWACAKVANDLVLVTNLT